ncbi:pectinesterase inhibitor-like [Vigna radiata var. radiata]|uniref:Pectinesterase inhibitor-like n=1 Tax=Vigna radiata var. radiata TaxID=3916 RepID=A0A1S3TMP9_VIGRR|nr:pectinesterase inhibitor-like [Vigna radiata var. radiata]
MDHFAKSLWVLALCVAVMTQQAAALDKSKGKPTGEKETPTGKTLIKKVCSSSPTKDLCVQVLSSDALSTTANLKELAIISLRVAARNASGILADTKVLIDDDELDPDIQQGLADCKENILDAESQLEDTIAALMVNSEGDAQLWLKAALAAIDTCDASIPGDDDILSVESAVFRKLCNIANSVIKQLPNPTKS